MLVALGDDLEGELGLPGVHLESVARGGDDEPASSMTTSMLSNGIKAHSTLEELKWALSEPGDSKDWDERHTC